MTGLPLIIVFVIAIIAMILLVIAVLEFFALEMMKEPRHTLASVDGREAVGRLEKRENFLQRRGKRHVAGRFHHVFARRIQRPICADVFHMA